MAYWLTFHGLPWLAIYFRHRAKDMKVFIHPDKLPNDPAGKASNVAYAFRQLYAEVKDYENVVLTIADADSEFGAGYFESLSCQFAASQSRYRIWQSPVFHMKNYHRQPAPVVVGTMFTSMQLWQHFHTVRLEMSWIASHIRMQGQMSIKHNRLCSYKESTFPLQWLVAAVALLEQVNRLSLVIHCHCATVRRQELSGLTDPNAVRFPYSTYSLPMTLARDVGGWDVEWIAEDYHMGIKRLSC